MDVSVSERRGQRHRMGQPMSRGTGQNIGSSGIFREILIERNEDGVREGAVH
jgi:hypothetical protein